MKVTKKAFTLIELIVVVTVIGILIMGLTVYLGGTGERARIIEAQGCAASFGGQMNNYAFNALTSRTLITPNNGIVSPDRYIITLGGGTSNDNNNCTRENFVNNGIYCNELRFLYAIDGFNGQPLYQTHTIGNTCRQNQARIGMFWSSNIEGRGDIEFISMNKGFAPRLINERKVFYLQNNGIEGGNADINQLTEGDIIVVVCLDNECSRWKEVGRYHVDGRTQTITFQKCRFYQEDSIRCEARED